MGGLLAADAALSQRPEAKRIVGMVFFDVPFLGMHPHVIVSGISSLFPDDEKPRSEKEMNNNSSVELPGTPSVDPSSGDTSIASSRSHSPPEPALADAGHQPSKHKDHHHHIFALSAKIDGFVSKHAANPFVIWLKRHQDDPFAAMYRWIVKNLEFGICMFDPPELLGRFQDLRKWNGRWMNYWTETVGDEGMEELQHRDSTHSMQHHDSVHSGIIPNSTSDLELVQHSSSNLKASSISELEEMGECDREEMTRLQKQLQEQRVYENTHKKRPPRHFIVLPGKEVRDSWERVKIRHAEDEVQAHCGLFMRNLNEEYEMLVSRVVGLVDYWCKSIVNSGRDSTLGASVSQ